MLDLFGDGFVLLAADPVWAAAVDALGVPLHLGLIPPDVASDWAEAYEVGPGGAALVRPDGHIAWRFASPAADSGADLSAALLVAAGRPS